MQQDEVETDKGIRTNLEPFETKKQITAQRTMLKLVTNEMKFTIF